MSCILHTTRRSNLTQKLHSRTIKHLEKNKEYHQSVCEASFGHKQSCTSATKIAEMVLQAFSLYHARTTQQQGKGKQAHSECTHYYWKQQISTYSFAQSDCTMPENPEEAFLTLFLSLAGLRNADSPAHPALLLHYAERN